MTDKTVICETRPSNLCMAADHRLLYTVRTSAFLREKAQDFETGVVRVRIRLCLLLEARISQVRITSSNELAD